MKILRTFGVAEGSDELGFSVGGSGGDREATIAPFVDALVEFRDSVRLNARGTGDKGALALCDEVRDGALVDLGVRVEDRRGESSLWKLDDPATLRREIEQKREQQREAALKKKAAKIDKVKKDIAKWEAAALTPTDLFRSGSHASKYSEYDDSGLPTKTADGEPLSKSQSKAVAKEMQKHVKAHNELNEKLGGEAYLAGLRTELAALEQDVA